ncbi:hypothetical protein MHA_2697 [Mannheimia haemolytica PHL213]|nr:hypothetical protein MHA_2697 [Mannheimia haemolytica PHL213]
MKISTAAHRNPSATKINSSSFIVSLLSATKDDLGSGYCE